MGNSLYASQMATSAPLVIDGALFTEEGPPDEVAPVFPAQSDTLWTLQCALFSGVEQAYGTDLARMLLNDPSHWPNASPAQVKPELEMIRSMLVQLTP